MITFVSEYGAAGFEYVQRQIMLTIGRNANRLPPFLGFFPFFDLRALWSQRACPGPVWTKVILTSSASFTPKFTRRRVSCGHRPRASLIPGFAIARRECG